VPLTTVLCRASSGLTAARPPKIPKTLKHLGPNGLTGVTTNAAAATCPDRRRNYDIPPREQVLP